MLLRVLICDDTYRIANAEVGVEILALRDPSTISDDVAEIWTLSDDFIPNAGLGLDLRRKPDVSMKPSHLSGSAQALGRLNVHSSLTLSRRWYASLAGSA